MRRIWRATEGGVVVALLALLTVLAFAGSTSPAQASSHSKLLHFYLHYAANPPSVGGVSTNYIMDTDRIFQDLKNSDIKEVGQPKIQVDWYLYPHLAGPVTFSGLWQVTIFVNASALHPSTWGLEFWEKNPDGTVVWGSGNLSPEVRGGPSGNEGFVDVPVFGYTLSAELSHTFTAGTTLELEVTINTGSTVSATAWYDSALYPSELILPSSDFARPASITTFDVNGTAREVFFTFWSADQRQVIIRAEVTDPFGGYDVYRVAATILDPSNRTVVANETMARIAGDRFAYGSTYEMVWPYPADALQGQYRVEVTVIDNNGRYNFEFRGTYGPYVEMLAQTFSIGVEYPVRFTVHDSRGLPLAGAAVAVFSGEVAVASGSTNAAGVLELTLFTGPFEVHVVWHGTLVAIQTVSLTNAASFTLQTAVYYPEFQFVSNAGGSINGAMVFISAPNGTNIRLPFLADANGTLSFAQHPAGEYGLLTFWQGILVADAVVDVTSDGPYVVRTRVYALTVNVTDSGQAPLEDVQVVVTSTIGRVFDFGITNATGQVRFNLPAGDYQVTSIYYGSYWLNYLVNRTRIEVPVGADSVAAISLSNIPPPIYSTIGFWLILGPILLAIGLVLGRRAGRRKPSPRPGAE